MGETVTLLEHRVRKAVERLRALDAERGRLTRELETQQGRSKALADAAETLDALARELGGDLPREGA